MCSVYRDLDRAPPNSGSLQLMCGMERGRNSQGQKGEPRRPPIRAGGGSVGSGARVGTVGISSRYEKVHPGQGSTRRSGGERDLQPMIK